MAIITISRGSYSKGKEVAEKVSQSLGYRCIGRELLLEASKEFNIPEFKLVRALHDAPSIFDKFTYGKEKYLAYLESALLKYLQGDDIVYHGLAGHFFLKGIAHALKVRIIADMADRVRLEMERENIGREEAEHTLKKDDEERRKWGLSLFGIDTWDPSLYDLVIHIRKISVDDAVDIICHTAKMGKFKTTFESQKAMDDLAVAAQVKAAIIDLKPDIQVVARDGNVLLGTRTYVLREPELIDAITKIARSIEGIKSVEVNVSHVVDWAE